MQHKMTFIAASIAAFTAAAGFAAPFTAGFEEFSYKAPHHEENVDAIIWYPTEPEAKTAEFAGNAVFQPVMASRNAPLAKGEFPLVLLSHGWGGAYFAQAWLGKAIAEKGAIVLSVNHPNSYFADLNEKVLHHWTRARDLSALLDDTLENQRFAGAIDQDRIIASGFSYGGWTALALGGARGNHSGFLHTCQQYETALLYCAEMNQGQFGVQEIAPDVWNNSYRDPRISAVYAIDAGLIWGLEAQDLSDLVSLTTLVGLGAGQDRMPVTDFDASGFLELVPEAKAIRIAPATHYTAMPLCTPRGAAILEAENDDPVCTDPKGTDRAKVHQMLIDGLWQVIESTK